MQILTLPMEPGNDPEAKTVGEYLYALLCAVLREGESFSGKRPFGNSGWTSDLLAPLVKAGLVNGAIDEDGYCSLSREEEVKAIKLLISAAAQSLVSGDTP